MSCQYCNLKKGPFRTEKIYVDFMHKIHALLKEGILNKLGQVDPAAPFIAMKYKCNKCSQNWILQVPDQAFRGGWYECEN